MTGREWGWRPAQAEGIWRHGARWTKPLFAAVPWITLVLLLVMFVILGDRLTAAPGVVFDLPAPVGRQSAVAGTTITSAPSRASRLDKPFLSEVTIAVPPNTVASNLAPMA